MQSHPQFRQRARQDTSSFQPRDRGQLWSSSGTQTKFNPGLEHRVLNSGKSEVNYSTSLLVFLESFLSIRHADEDLPFCINISGKSRLSWKTASSHRQKQKIKPRQMNI